VATNSIYDMGGTSMSLILDRELLPEQLGVSLAKRNANAALIETAVDAKVNTTDIVDDLTSTDVNKPS